MPFGRHKGQPLENIPADYLDWLLGLPDLKPRLRKAVQAELDRREATAGWETPSPSRPPPPPKPNLEPLVASWRRRLALRHHPDAGGSHAAMLAVDDADRLLRELLAAEGWLRG